MPGSKRPDLFGKAEAYAQFSGLPDEYPRDSFIPKHPRFTQRGHVNTTGKNPRQYYVDMSIGECTCPKGAAFAFDYKGQKYYAAAYCSHKMRALAAFVNSVQPTADRTSVEFAYLQALATRYNVFEVVSAFHKELRRGDFTQAWFWALVLSTKRKIRGVFSYMLNILYEETRDHELGLHLIATLGNPRAITLSNLTKTISWFCATKKKWELPHRFQIFEAEMYGYKKLADAYTKEVAKGGNIIPEAEGPKLVIAMRRGLDSNDLVEFQRGLKGLQKLKHDKIEDHRHWLYEALYELAEKRCKDTHDVWAVIAVVNARINAGHGIGYHELNAIADALAGEPYEPGVLPPKAREIHLKRPSAGVPLGLWPIIPLYAHDNHTWAGKSLMRRFQPQLRPGAKQVDLDFRWCGAYFGVAFRTLAGQQNKFKIIDVKWEDVKWPKQLYEIVDMLWY